MLVGCGAGGVLGAGARSSAAPPSPCGPRRSARERDAFHAEVIETPDAIGVTGLPDLDDATAIVLLPDPYSFPTDAVLAELARRAPGVPIVGGLASARTLDGDAALFLDDELSPPARSASPSRASRSCRASRRAPRPSAPS